MRNLKIIIMLMTLSLGLISGCGETDMGNKQGEDAEIIATVAPTNAPAVDAGQVENQDTQTEVDSTPTPEVTVTSTPTPTPDPNAIRENGQLPESIRELTDKEKHHYVKLVFEAMQTLDIEALTQYADDEKYLKSIRAIAANAEWADFWKSVLGDMVYFEDSDILIYRSPEWIFGQWFMEQEAAGAALVEELWMLPNEEAVEIYNTYFKKAPYVGKKFAEDLSYSIQNGYFKCNLNKFFGKIVALSTDYFKNGAFSYAVLLMGPENALILGYDYIAKKIPEYEILLSWDLDAFCEYVDVNLPEDNKHAYNSFYNCYSQYYADLMNRAIMQEYVDENCLAVRDVSNVWLFKKVSYNTDYPFRYADSEDKKAMAEYDIYYTGNVLKGLAENWRNDFAFYCDMADAMKMDGYFE